MTKHAPRRTSWLAKLGPSEIATIRQRSKKGDTQTELARDFKVSQATISKILNRQIYRNV
jgi:DNA-binding MarR family transcriptional regulator